MEKLRRITAPLAQESAVALGFFDGVHLGHRAVLGAAAQCAAAQGLMACAFTFAADSVPVKQGVPLTYLYTDAQKAELMQDCGIHGVYCPAFSELCALDGESFCRQVLVELLHAREVFCGGDFRLGGVEHRQSAGIRQADGLCRASDRPGALRRRENFVYGDP